MSDRRIATVVMLDVVGSTQIAAQLGDARYRELSSRFVRSVRAEVKRFGGHEEDNAGDGFFVTFPQPDRAIRFATTLADEVRDLGIEIRSGVHTGQTEHQDRKTQGIAVVIGSRVMSLAGAGEVLVTSTTKELVTGSDFGFEDFSAHELKGVPGTWRVFAVTSIAGERRPRPLGAEESARRLSSIQPQQVRERRRRAALAAGGSAALLVITAIALAIMGRDDDPPTSPSRAPRAESIVQVDPSTGEILDEVPAPVPQRGLPGMQRGTPDHAMASGQGGVWTLRSYRWLYHVDALTHQLRQVIALEIGGGALSLNAAVGLDEVWVASERSLIEVDPATYDQRHVLDFSTGGPLTSDLAVGGGYVWIATTSRGLVRFDPRTEHSRATDIGGTADAIAFGHDSVWIGDALAGTVTRYDAGSLRADRPSLVPQGAVDHIVVASDVWVLSRDLGAITPIDPTTGLVGRSIPVGDAPTGIAVGDGAIWVGDEDGIIRRVDEDTGQVTEVPFGPEIRTLAFDDETDTLWVDVA